MRTSSAYSVFGVEPVASPITHLPPFAVFSLIRLAITSATYFDPSLGEGKIFTGIFSKESIISTDIFMALVFRCQATPVARHLLKYSRNYFFIQTCTFLIFEIIF